MVVRTLRRQVKEYVKFTARRSIVEDFAPTPEEQELYDRVSEYLRRDDAYAIPPARRALFVLVYRKILASSSFALAATLDRLADGARGEGGRGASAPPRPTWPWSWRGSPRRSRSSSTRAPRPRVPGASSRSGG